MGSGMAMAYARGPFGGLLIAQLFFVAVTPFVADGGAGRAFFYLAVFGIMGACAYVSASSRNLLIISTIFLLTACIAWLGPDVLPGEMDQLLRLGVVGVGTAFTAVIVLATVAQHDRVTTDTILGGINAYLLIAVAFTMFHSFVMVLEPSAYKVGGVSLHHQLLGQEDQHGYATLLYFSFTTLTTLGYGDMVPVNPVARLLTSGEAVLGQLFVAIFIARLVSLEVSQRTITQTVNHASKSIGNDQ